MPDQTQTQSITSFRGLNERKIVGSNLAETTSLLNVIIRDGVVSGRKGINEWDNITTASGTTPIISLMDHYLTSAATSSLLRMTPTAVHKWNSGTSAWDTVTGTALNGTATTRPQFCQIGELDYLAFTNEGLDRPRKYTGSGNTAVLGGTPPYCKAIEFYVGFLALGNCSTDGSTFSPIQLIMSDDPDGTWTECSDVEMFVVTLYLDETPGEIRALKVLGPTLMAYKADGIVGVQFTAGPTRFRRQRLEFPLGILAPLSLQSIGARGHLFLATDRNLYINNGTQVTPLPPNVQKTLRESLSAADMPYVRSMVDPDNDVYALAVQRTGTNYFESILEYNYESGDFTTKTYPVEFNALLGYRRGFTTAVARLAASSTLVYELETGTDDNGTAVSRYYDIDWSQYGTPGTKLCTGAEFVFERAANCRVAISIAADKIDRFRYERIFRLNGDDPDSTQVRVRYTLPSPLIGSWFKFHVRFLHDGAMNVTRMMEFEPLITPISAAPQATPVGQRQSSLTT